MGLSGCRQDDDRCVGAAMSSKLACYADIDVILPSQDDKESAVY